MSCASANAQLFRTYLASSGSDGNPCTLILPCRLLPAAHAAVASGGEIWMLDSANFNTSQVDITKSVTILAIPGAVGSVVSTGGGHGININAPGIKVTLRNLVIVHLTSSHYGVNFAQGAELNVADCEIANVNIGISATASGSAVTVKNTILRGVSDSGLYVSGTVVASLDGVHSKGNLYGVLADPGSRVTVSNSVLSGNTYGAMADAPIGSTRLVVERSVVTGNQYGLVAQSISGATANLTVSQSTVTHNSTVGISAAQFSSTTTVVADGNTIAENGIGFEFSLGTPTIYTRGNNTLKFNTSGDVAGGSLTALAGQ
jgi:hypothetical protein